MLKATFLLVFCCLAFGLPVSVNAQPCIPNPSSLDFNGSNSFARVNSLNGLDMLNQITVEAWINPKLFASSSTGNSIFCKHAWGGSMYGYVLRCGGNGILSFNIAGAVGASPVGWQEVLSPPGSLSLDTWQHVAGTFDGTVLTVYVNGNQLGTYPFSGTVYPSTGTKARIGALADTSWGMSRYFNGLIDEVRVWDRALSQTEIQSGMNDHLDPALQTGLIGYWRLNENGGNLLADLGSGGNNATAVNTTWSSQVPFNNNSLPMPVITYQAPNLVSSYVSGNQWFIGTTLIPGANQQTYTPTQYGYYKVQVTDSIGCTAISLPFNFNTTGISLPVAAQLLLWPNPAKGQLRVQLPEGFIPECLRLTDRMGRQVLSLPWQEVSSGTIELESISPGLYILMLSNSQQQYSSRLLLE